MSFKGNNPRAKYIVISAMAFLITHVSFAFLPNCINECIISVIPLIMLGICFSGFASVIMPSIPIFINDEKVHMPLIRTDFRHCFRTRSHRSESSAFTISSHLSLGLRIGWGRLFQWGRVSVRVSIVCDHECCANGCKHLTLLQMVEEWQSS